MPGEPGCPKARSAQLYCCCLVLITPRYSFNLEIEQGQFWPHLIPVTEGGGGNVPGLAGRGPRSAWGRDVAEQQLCWESQGAPVCVRGPLSRTIPSRLHPIPGAAQHCYTWLFIVLTLSGTNHTDIFLSSS